MDQPSLIAKFVSEDMAEKPVTKLPGIGPVAGENLAAANFHLVGDVYRKCRQFNVDQVKFQNWLENICGVNHKQSAECYEALLEWDRQLNHAQPKTVAKYGTNNIASTGKCSPEKVKVPNEQSKVDTFPKKEKFGNHDQNNIASTSRYSPEKVEVPNQQSKLDTFPKKEKFGNHDQNNIASTSKYSPEKVEVPNEQSKVNTFPKKEKFGNHYIHILHQNIAGLVNKLVRFMHALKKYEKSKNINVGVICITEHNMKLGAEDHFDEPGYKLAASFCRPQDVKKSRGGACIIVRNDVKYRSISTIKDMSIPNIFECCAIELIPYNIIVVCIYRVPNNKESQTIVKFFERLRNLLRTIRREKNKHLIVAGDFNINILDSNTTTQNFEALLLMHDLRFATQQITRPCAQKCIDNIAHDFIEDWKSAVEEFNVSDHKAVLLTCPVDKESVEKLLQEKETEQEDLSKLLSRFDQL